MALRSTHHELQQRILVLGLALLLAACDAWPTIVDNRTTDPIAVQYLHRDYDHWSADFPVKAGFALPFARAHWIQEIRGIRIKDGRHLYSWTEAGIRRLASACPSSQFARNLSFAGNCYLLYAGKGQLQAVAEAPAGLQYE